MKRIFVFALLFAFLLSGCSEMGGSLEQLFVPPAPTGFSETTEPETEPPAPTETEPSVTEPAETVPATEASKPVEVAPKTPEETIAALNALLVGLRHNEYFHQRGAVSEWSDDAICQAIYAKLLWHNYGSGNAQYLDTLNLEPQYDSESYYEFYDLDAIDAIALSCFGREYPRNSSTDHSYVANGHLYIMPATGESESVVVQSFTQQGNMLTAYGTAVHHNNVNSVFDGYFTAQFEVNPDSLYGYTLISYNAMPGNQNFSNLTAEASSILRETDFTHYADNVLDGSLSTAWVEGVSGVGIGEWIKLSTTDGSSLDLTAIGFYPGYHKSQSHLENNGYPTEILIEAENGFSQTAYLFWHEDDVVLLDQPISTSWVKITILDAEAGKAFEDTCISEIPLYGLDI